MLGEVLSQLPSVTDKEAKIQGDEVEFLRSYIKWQSEDSRLMTVLPSF